MKVVTTKDELRYALRQKDESIIIKGDLATVMRKALKTSIIISAAFAVATLVVISFIGWPDRQACNTRRRHPCPFGRLGLCLRCKA